MGPEEGSGVRGGVPSSASAPARKRPPGTDGRGAPCAPPSRAQAQSGAPPRNAPADGRARYARNRVPPHRPAGGGERRNRGAQGMVSLAPAHPQPGRGVRPAPCPRARAQSGARTAPPRNARTAGRARYARNRVPLRGPAGGGLGRNRGAQATAPPAPARPQPGGGACPAPGPRARRRNQAREPRRRVTRARTGAGDTRETGFRRTGRPAAGRGGAQPGAQGTASPAPARPQPGGRACPAPCPRARRRNRARRRVTRPRTGARVTRETGFPRTGRPAAGRGATGGRREWPLPPRPTRSRAEERVLRPALARAGAIRRANRAAA